VPVAGTPVIITQIMATVVDMDMAAMEVATVATVVTEEEDTVATEGTGKGIRRL